MSRTNFDQLLEAGCHFGHLRRKWNPAMAPYIFMERIIRHAVRGMLPKGSLGRQLLGNLYIYDGTEHKHEAQKPKAIDINQYK